MNDRQRLQDKFNARQMPVSNRRSPKLDDPSSWGGCWKEMNQPHLYELQQRYAKMSPEEFADIRREYLTEEAVTCYDQEVNRRNTPKWKEAEYKYYQELSHSDSIEREYNKRLRKVARLWQTVLSILLVISFLVFRPQLTPSNQAVCVNLRCYNTWDEYLRKSIREEAIEAGLSGTIRI